MNARERLLNSFWHKPVDRVPISTYELVGWNPDAWENREPSYRRLMDEIRARTDCLFMADPDWTGSAKPFRTVKTWREGNRVFTRTVLQTGQKTLEQLQRADDAIHTVWTLEHYLKEDEDIAAWLSLPYETPRVSFSRFDEQARQLGERGLMMMSVPDPICEAAELFSMEDFLVLARTEFELAKYLLDALFERQQAMLRQMLAHDVRNVVIRICGPEYATPPYLPPELFRELVTVYLIPVCRQIRDAGAIPRIHCHGRIRAVIDQFAETDALAIEPLEPPPDGDISLDEIKRRYGQQFCLMGNLELRELENSSPERIEELVRQAMVAAKDGGGFVLMPTAAPINSPLSARTEANYLQMIDSAWKYGQFA